MPADRKDKPVPMPVRVRAEDAPPAIQHLCATCVKADVCAGPGICPLLDFDMLDRYRDRVPPRLLDKVRFTVVVRECEFYLPADAVATAPADWVERVRERAAPEE